MRGGRNSLEPISTLILSTYSKVQNGADEELTDLGTCWHPSKLSGNFN